MIFAFNIETCFQITYNNLIEVFILLMYSSIFNVCDDKRICTNKMIFFLKFIMIYNIFILENDF